MNVTKQDVLRLIEEIPENNFDLHAVIDELAYRLTLQQRLSDAEQGKNTISDEVARKRFNKWLSD